MVMPLAMTFDLTPLADDDSDRGELTCIWCHLRGCDHTFMLKGHGTTVSGIHERCLRRHNEIVGKVKE